MSSDYEAVVLGLGGMGSAALAHIAARGKRVLGIEAFDRNHDWGASAGRSRIIRKAYFEDPSYVPLLVRAYQLWRELERASGTRILDLTGVLLAGDPAGAVLRGARDSAHRHGIPIEELDGRALSSRYPALLLRPGEVGLFEPEAGIVFPEAAIDAHLRTAEAAGAETRFGTRALAYRGEPDSIAIELEGGVTVRTKRLAICAGPWIGDIVAGCAAPVRVQRNVQLWFRPSVADYGIDRFPAFLVERKQWPVPLYGFPDYGAGVKAALHAYGEDTTARALDRAIRPADVDAVRAALDAWMPGAAGALIEGKACMYALTPDEHFIVDLHPDDRRVTIAGGFSGHGFKFAAVVGEIVADLVLAGRTSHPIDFLRLGRFAA